MRSIGIFIVGVLVASNALAIELGMPVECQMGTDCVVQNYVDHDPQSGDKAYTDFRCEGHSYDGHKGTDVRTINEVIMKRGIPVLAAADGVVLGARDGVEDGAAAKTDMECGNGARITHAEGWITQYCHMRKGSVKVRRGEVVKMGQQLGLIGLSGKTAFPHVHFQVEHNGDIIDPYTGQPQNSACHAGETNTLWSAQAQQPMAYTPTGFLGAGFTSHKPKDGELQQGLHSNKTLSGKEPLLIFWTELYGVEKDDIIYVSMQNPQGIVLAEQTKQQDRTRAVQHQYIGKIQRDTPWPMGTYIGILTLKRDGEMLLKQQFQVKVAR